MDFYDFTAIKEAGSCVAFARDVLGVQVNAEGRCAAAWRGGHNASSVALTDHEWYDHSRKEGGGILDLCAAAKFGGDIQQAQEFLGQWLRLEPKNKTRRVEPAQSRYNHLLADGYAEAARYYYQEVDGRTRHIVVRMEHPEKHKEFLQRTPEFWGVKGVDLILYGLATWVNSCWVVVVEGEKDADTLHAWGLPATTNCGGAEKWQESFNEQFRGKDVVVCRDNDDAGRDHARVVMRNVARVARSIRLICPSAKVKGDVTDWRDNEGGTREKLMEVMQAAVPIQPEQAEGTDEEWAVMAAKKANQKRLSNTHSVVKTVDGLDKRVEEARQIRDLITEVHTRFLGFPRKVGDSRMFDHDRDTKRVEPIDGTAALFAWIGRKSGKTYHWGKASGCVSKEELYEGLIQDAPRYESISEVPDWPRRADVFYIHDTIPDADPERRWFNGLMEFFAPADEASRILIRTLFAAPIFFEQSIPRPSWVIDSEDGAGMGKTTLVEILAELYSAPPIKTSKKELIDDFKELIKRMISSDGRKSRVLLVDNVTGTFAVDSFADLVTSAYITGKAPYGRGEESRPNNLTYVITSNSAQLNNDTSSRSYMIKLKEPVRSKNWKRNVLHYIRTHRLAIFADIMATLNEHKPFPREPISRFPEFEVSILQAMCGNEENYDAVCRNIIEDRSEANVDDELAKQVEEIIRYRLQEMNIEPDENMVFIRAPVIEIWTRQLGNNGLKINDVRNLAKTGLLKRVDKSVRRFPASDDGKGTRRTGLMWVGENVNRDVLWQSVAIIGQGGKGDPCIVGGVALDGRATPEKVMNSLPFEVN